MLGGLAVPGFGDAHRKLVERLPHVQATIALLIDGHHGDDGGRVTVDGDGRIKLHYPFTSGLREAALHATQSIARLQLAAGAREVMTLHDPPRVIRDEAGMSALADIPVAPNDPPLFSAHQMGGCPMGEGSHAVVDSRGRHHDFENLWITDGSVFPTGLGINPMLTIYALGRLFATGIAAGK
jgi:choline dehydrogenase-like flavoprotein